LIKLPTLIHIEPKKGGDFAVFWQKQSSFIEVMEDFYLRMRKITLKAL
jgi:hypothetical protein